MSIPVRNLSLLIVSALAAICLLPGCCDETIPCEPEVPAGRIEGFITSSESLERMTVIFTRPASTSAGELILVTRPDETGYYGMDLPAGSYTVAVEVTGYPDRYEYNATEISYGQIPADIFQVDHRHSYDNINFSFGSVSIQVNLSQTLEGEDGEIWLNRRGAASTGSSRSYIDYGKARIDNGSCLIEVPGLLPGEYKVEIVLGRRLYLCHCPWDGEHFWYPGTRDSTQSPWINVPADSVVSLTASVSPNTARLEGEIIGAWQDLSYHIEPHLAIYDTTGVKVMGRRGVKNDGTFSVDIHIPGPVKLLACHDSMEQWIGGATFEEANTYTLINGETISGIRLVESALQLTATDQEIDWDAQIIRFYYADDLSLAATWQSDFNIFKSGVNIFSIRPAEYLMHLEPASPGSSPWIAQWFDRAANAEAAEKVIIPADGDIVPLVVTFTKGGAIRGSLAPSTQTPGNHYIVVTPADEKLSWGYLVCGNTDLDFEVLGLPDGEWKLGFWPLEGEEVYNQEPPDHTIWHPGTTAWNEATVFTIQDATEINDLILTIP